MNLKTPPERRMSDYLKQPYNHTENEVRIVSTLKTAQPLQRRTCFFFDKFQRSTCYTKQNFLEFHYKINKQTDLENNNSFAKTHSGTVTSWKYQTFK